MSQTHAQVRSHSVVLCLMLGILLAAVTGCGGGGGVGLSGGSVNPPGGPANLANYQALVQWASLIEQAGLPEYAALGRQLSSGGKAIFVSPPTLGETFNAFSWIAQKEIWINSPLFSRYPKATDQAEIFLHELIHLKSGEASHVGPWWSALDEYRQYWSER